MRIFNKLTIVACLLVLMVVAISAIANAYVIPNGGFETGSKVPWEYYEVDGLLANISTEDPYEGSYHVNITVDHDQGGTVSNYFYLDGFNTSEVTNLSLKFKFKNQSQATGWNIYAQFTDNGTFNNPVQQTSLSGTAQTYQVFNKNVTAAGVKRLSIWFNVAGSYGRYQTWFFIDDIRVNNVPNIPPDNATGILYARDISTYQPISTPVFYITNNTAGTTIVLPGSGGSASYTFLQGKNYTVICNATGYGNETETFTGYETGFSLLFDMSPVQSGFSMTPSEGTAPLTVYFTDQSYGSPTSYYWNYGDGLTSTSVNPSHTYNAAGNYTVTHNVTYSNGETYSSSGMVTVLTYDPTVSFTAAPQTGNAPLLVYFYGSTIGGTATSWNWNFGDGTANSTTQNPSHTYNSPGSYTVTVTASSVNWTKSYQVTNCVIVSANPLNSQVFGFNATSYTVYAQNNSITLPVNYGGSGSTASVSYTTIAGSATAGINYQTTTGTLTYSPGQTSKTITVPILDDGVKTTRVFYVQLHDPSTGSSLSTVYWQASVTILNPDNNQYVVNAPTNLHVVGITFVRWLVLPVGNGASIKVYQNGTLINQTTTDDNGHVSFMLYSDVQYQTLYNDTKTTKWFNRTMENSAYWWDVTTAGESTTQQGQIKNSTGGNATGSTGNPDVDIITSAIWWKNSTTGIIQCNYTDLSSSTTSINLTVYTRNQSDPQNMTLLYTHVYNGVQQVVYNYTIAHDPAGEDYKVTFYSTYSTSNGATSVIEREYAYTYMGPMRLIPYMPVGWYVWVSFLILLLIGVSVGASGVEEGLVAIACIGTLFWFMGWFYGFAESYAVMALGIVWPMAISAVILKRERTGRM